MRFPDFSTHSEVVFLSAFHTYCLMSIDLAYMFINNLNLLKVTKTYFEIDRCIFSWFEAAWHFRLGHYNARILVLSLLAKPTTTTYHCLFLQSRFYDLLMMMLMKIMRSCTWNLKKKKTHFFLLQTCKVTLQLYEIVFFLDYNRLTLIIGWPLPLFEIQKVWLKQINSTQV